MKKVFISVMFLTMLLFSSLAAEAGFINNEYEAKQYYDKVVKLSGTDFASFINKSEIIGEKQTSYIMATEQYRNMLQVSAEIINSLNAKAEIVKKSPDYSDTDKQAEIAKIYMEIETALYDVNSHTLNYLMRLRSILPSVTYYKYNEKFQEYYNSYNLTPVRVQNDSIRKLR